MNTQQRKNSIKRIIILLIVLIFVALFKESIGQEFEGFLTNYYFEQASGF